MSKMLHLILFGLCLQYAFGHPVEVDKYPELKGKHFQGDMLFAGDDKNGMIDERYRWPGGVIPYEIVGTFTDEELAVINSAIEQYSINTCLTLRQKTADDEDYVSIGNFDQGCYSYVGRIGGEQVLNLESPGCVRVVGTAIHELMHAAGFHHEQSRPDRDDFVTIVWENIISGYEGNFDKYSADVVTGFGQPYDYGSIMHYPASAFSNNGEDTIVPVDPNAVIGQRDGFSALDIAKLNAMYENICTKK